MKAVLLSIQPKYCKLIASGKKTIEVRKTAPKLEAPFKCYIYMTKSKERLIEVVHKGDDIYGTTYNEDTPLFIKVDEDFLAGTPFYGRQSKVIGEFVCDKVEQFTVGSLGCDDIQTMACLSYKEMIDYFYKPEELDGNTVKFGYGLHISQLKIYDKPKELGEFTHCCQKGFNDMNNYLCYREHYSGRITQCKYNDMKNGECKAQITRPPQSWCYIEELK